MQPPHGYPPGGPPPQYGHAPHPQQAYAPQPQGYAHQGYPQYGYPGQGYPAQGHGQPPPQALAPHAAAMVPQSGARTVWGHPLEPGEKVVYYKRLPRTGARIFMFLMGFPTILMFGLGFYLIYLAIADRKNATYAQVITNKRLMAYNGAGKVEFSIRWEEIAGMNKVLRNGATTAFGVRNRNGQKFMYTSDLMFVERVIEQGLDNPKSRDQSGEVYFDAVVV